MKDIREYVMVCVSCGSRWTFRYDLASRNRSARLPHCDCGGKVRIVSAASGGWSTTVASGGAPGGAA